MAGSGSSKRRKRTRAEYQRGLPGYHDPTARWGGASPALSALTLRLWLAGFGLVVCVAGAIIVARVGGPGWFVVLLIVLAVIAAIDLAWVAYRKWRGEPG